jgi:hypothetical protein
MNRRLRGFHGFNDSQPPFSRPSGGFRVRWASCPPVRASRLNGLPDVRARPTPSGRPRRKMRRSAGGTPTLPDALRSSPGDSSFLKGGRTEEVTVPGTNLPIRAICVICGSSGVGATAKIENRFRVATAPRTVSKPSHQLGGQRENPRCARTLGGRAARVSRRKADRSCERRNRLRGKF